MNRLRIPIVLVAAALLVGCNLKDPGGSVNPNNENNNDGTNNMATNNTATNAATNNNTQTNSATNNNSQPDAGNNANNTPDMGNPDMGGDPDMGPPPPSLPSSAAVTGGSLSGESANYKVRMQVGAPHAAEKPKSENYEAQVAPPSGQ